jgi:hypothetical protein
LKKFVSPPSGGKYSLQTMENFVVPPSGERVRRKRNGFSANAFL